MTLLLLSILLGIAIAVIVNYWLNIEIEYKPSDEESKALIEYVKNKRKK